MHEVDEVLNRALAVRVEARQRLGGNLLGRLCIDIWNCDSQAKGNRGGSGEISCEDLIFKERRGVRGNTENVDHGVIESVRPWLHQKSTNVHVAAVS